IRERNRSAVDRVSLPAGSEAAPGEGLAKSACWRVWVAEHEPNALGISISHTAVGGLMDAIWDDGGFIEDDKKAFAFVMQTLGSEQFGWPRRESASRHRVAEANRLARVRANGAQAGTRPHPTGMPRGQTLKDRW